MHFLTAQEEKCIRCGFMAHQRSERGPYAKGIAKRAEILDVALDVIAREGYDGATVKLLADEVGLSQNGLLRYFGSKDALFVEVLRHQQEQLMIDFDPDRTDFSLNLTDRVLDAVTANITAAGLSQLQLSVTMAALDPEHQGHTFIKDRYQAFRSVTADTLRALQERGEFPVSGDPDAAATLITAAFDGLQAQWMYDKSIDVRGRMRYLLEALGVATVVAVPN